VAWRLLKPVVMRSRTYLVAAALGTLGTVLATPPARADEDEDAYEGDGPEADAVVEFKLDELIEVAMRRSPDVVRSKVDRSAAKGQAGASRANQQWVMTMGAQYQKQGVTGQVEVAPFATVATDSINGAIGLGRNLPTGGRLDLEVGVARSIREINVPVGFATTAAATGSGSGSGSNPQVSTCGLNGADEDKCPQIQSTARLTLKQPLVRGFGPDIALAAENKADFAFSEATIKAQLAAEDMIREIVAGYWELAYASHEVDIRAEALALAEAQEKLTREELRAGKAPQNAVNAVIYEIAVRKEAQLRAQLEAEKKSLELRRKVGLGLGRREVLMRPGEAFEIGESEWDIEEVLAQSRKANRKLATIALQKKIADVDVKVAKNATLPQVDVSLSGGLLGDGQTTSESIGALGGATRFEVMASLQVSFELSGAAKSNHDAALAKRRRLDIDRADLERQIDAEVVNAVKAVTFARTRVMLSDKAISVGEDNLKAERLSFVSGKATNYNVMQRQTELIEARLRRGRAVADYHIAVAQLQFLGGTLLEQYRVNVRPRGERR